MRIIFFHIAFLVTFFVTGKNSLDSIKTNIRNQISQATNDYDRAKHTYNLGVEYYYSNGDSALYFFDRAQHLLNSIDSATKFHITLAQGKASLFRDFAKYSAADSLYNYSIEYAKNNNFEPIYHEVLARTSIITMPNKTLKERIDSIPLLEGLCDLLDSNNTKHQSLKIATLTDIAVLFANSGQFKKAIPYFKRIYNFRKRYYIAKDVVKIDSYLNSLNNLGLAYELIGQLDSAIHYYKEGLFLSENSAGQKSISRLYGNIGSLYAKKNNFYKAIEYAKRSLEHNPNDPILLYSLLLLSYNELGMDSLAYQMADIAFSLSEENKSDKSRIARLKLNRGFLYLKNKQFDLSLKDFKEAQIVFDKIASQKNLEQVNIALFRLYLSKNDWKNVEEQFKWLDKNMKDVNNLAPLRKLDYFQALSEYYEKKNNYKVAFYYQSSLYDLKNKRDSAYHSNSLNQAFAEVEVYQKENQILKLQNQHQNQKLELNALQDEQKIILFSAILLLLLFFTAGILLFQRKKIRIKEDQIHQTEIIQKEIGLELHDQVAGKLLGLAFDIEKHNPQLGKKVLLTSRYVAKLSHDLDYKPEKYGNLTDDLEDILTTFEVQGLTYKISPEEIKLDKKSKIHIVRIVQELLSNNLKHSKADQTIFNIIATDDLITIEYKDNGIGFHEDDKKNGLFNIYNRVEIMKGSIKFPKVEKGIFIRIEIPLA
ncbi:MAG: tetratricopeptide repeat protein [Flavobacteriales bacterium]|jgi:signal transduction histidine kinase|nr:tetratricopeptide repeat protein [Flavobacteriales bacterium]